MQDFSILDFHPSVDKPVDKVEESHFKWYRVETQIFNICNYSMYHTNLIVVFHVLSENIGIMCIWIITQAQFKPGQRETEL